MPTAILPVLNDVWLQGWTTSYPPPYQSSWNEPFVGLQKNLDGTHYLVKTSLYHYDASAIPAGATLLLISAEVAKAL